MIERLLSFLDASPVSFLAVRNIANELEKNGFRRVNAQEPLGKVEAGDRFFVTKNDSSVYAFHIGKKPLADAGFHMICAHCDSPTFRVKPNAEMDCEGGIVKLNTEVYGGPIMSTWFDRPLTLAGRVIVKGDDVMRPKTLLLHVKRPLLQISNLAIHFNRQVNDGVKLSRQKDVLPILGIINDEMEKGNLLMNVITDELNVKREDILDFDLYLADATPACTLARTVSLSPLAVSTTCRCAGREWRPCSRLRRRFPTPHGCSPSSTTRRQARRPSREPAARSSPTC